jgi:hypothetical protein
LKSKFSGFDCRESEELKSKDQIFFILCSNKTFRINCYLVFRLYLSYN